MIRLAYPLLVLAVGFVPAVAAQQPAPSPDSAVYRAVLDSLYPAGEVALIRQFYGGPKVGTVETLLRRWRDAEWIDSNQVVTPTPDGGATIHFAVWLSPITYGDDRRTAILTVRMACGGLCGYERLVSLALRPSGRWELASVETTIRH
jgi:hypothetical protein